MIADPQAYQSNQKETTVNNQSGLERIKTNKNIGNNHGCQWQNQGQAFIFDVNGAKQSYGCNWRKVGRMRQDSKSRAQKNEKIFKHNFCLLLSVIDYLMASICHLILSSNLVIYCEAPT